MDRSDAYVEDHNWHDAGCSIAASCLNCPLAQCRYDRPYNMQKAQSKYKETVALLSKGVPRYQILTELGISLRQYYRYVEKSRRAKT